MAKVLYVKKPSVWVASRIILATGLYYNIPKGRDVLWLEQRVIDDLKAGVVVFTGCLGRVYIKYKKSTFI